MPLNVTESKVTVPPYMYASPPCERGRNKEVVLTFLSNRALECSIGSTHSLKIMAKSRSASVSRAIAHMSGHSKGAMDKEGRQRGCTYISR